MSAETVIRLAPGAPELRGPDPAGPGGEAPVLTPAPPRARPRRVPWAAILSFFALVILPVSAIGTYYAREAADQFTARAQFTVRETSARPLRIAEADTAPDRIGGGLAMSEVSPLTHVVASYLESPALLRDLSREIDVAALYRVPEADFWTRLPEDATAEARYEHWRDRLRVAVDGPSGIVTLELRAFRAEDARRLAARALFAAEALVNALSARQKREALARAEAEAEAAARRLAASLAELTAFRDSAGLLDPEREGAERLRLLSELAAERIRLEGELRVLGAVVDADAARARALEARLESVRAELAGLREGLAAEATADANIAAALARYEALEIRRRFAARLYGLAQTRRIDAEIDLARQTVFLNVFDPPQRPEESDHPKRFGFTLLAFLGLAAAWAVLALVWAAVADHRLDRRR